MGSCLQSSSYICVLFDYDSGEQALIEATVPVKPSLRYKEQK